MASVEVFTAPGRISLRLWLPFGLPSEWWGSKLSGGPGRWAGPEPSRMSATWVMLNPVYLPRRHRWG